MKLYKIKIKDTEEDISIKYIAAETLQDIYNQHDNILEVKQLEPFELVDLNRIEKAQTICQDYDLRRIFTTNT